MNPIVRSQNWFLDCLIIIKISSYIHKCFPVIKEELDIKSFINLIDFNIKLVRGIELVIMKHLQQKFRESEKWVLVDSVNLLKKPEKLHKKKGGQQLNSNLNGFEFQLFNLFSFVFDFPQGPKSERLLMFFFGFPATPWFT
jgi:hypothetical protein